MTKNSPLKRFLTLGLGLSLTSSLASARASEQTVEESQPKKKTEVIELMHPGPNPAHEHSPQQRPYSHVTDRNA